MPIINAAAASPPADDWPITCPTDTCPRDLSCMCNWNKPPSPMHPQPMPVSPDTKPTKLCDKCTKNPATVKFEGTIRGSLDYWRICQDCRDRVMDWTDSDDDSDDDAWTYPCRCDKPCPPNIDCMCLCHCTGGTQKVRVSKRPVEDSPLLPSPKRFGEPNPEYAAPAEFKRPRLSEYWVPDAMDEAPVNVLYVASYTSMITHNCFICNDEFKCLIRVTVKFPADDAAHQRGDYQAKCCCPEDEEGWNLCPLCYQGQLYRQQAASDSESEDEPNNNNPPTPPTPPTVPPSPIPTDKEARAALAKELFGDMSWMDDKTDKPENQ